MGARLLTSAGLLVALGACRGSGEEPAARSGAMASPPQDELAEKLRHCPLTVAGIEVALADTEGGVRFELTASTTAAIDEVRRRAHHMAEFSRGRGRNEHGGGKGGGFMRNCPVVSKDTAVVADDIERGVAVIVTALPPTGVDDLRGETRRRLQALRASPP